MALNLEDKKQIVSEVAAVAASAHSAVAAEYRGLSVGEMTELRAKARETGVYLRVVKNSLARRAVEGTDFACMQEGFVGPLVLAFSQEDPGAAARLVKDFAKEHKKLEVKLVSVGGQLLGPGELERLASLPNITDLKDPKTRLQEHLQATRQALPVYTVLEISGKAHDQSFRIQCQISDSGTLTEGVGSSRRQAEQRAAEAMLEALKAS